MREGAYIYFLSNWDNSVLYLGVTNNLARRVAEHKAKVDKSFSEKYNCDRLVYYETGESIVDAITREKQLKKWKREWKDELITNANPTWDDLSESVGVTQEFVDAVAEAYKHRQDSGSSPE